MKLSKATQDLIEQSVLCWLATVSPDGQPNVSPKECFAVYNNEVIIIANIASPQSESNIQQEAKVCVSFLDIFIQKGIKMYGQAELIREGDERYLPYRAILQLLVKDKFPFRSVIAIRPTEINKIQAPSYLFYPQTTEQDQINDAMEAYGVKSIWS